MKSATMIACLAALLPCVAWAQTPRADEVPTEPPAAVAEETHLVSVTWSPVHLAIGMFELTGEIQVAPKVAVAVIAGAGSSTQQTVTINGPTEYDVSLYEVGAQAAYYLLGDFDTGLKVGAEGGYLGASTSTQGVEATGSGIWYGVFLGGKKTFGFGLTGGIDLGVQQIRVSARASSGSDSATTTDSATGALLNLQLGWSF